MQDSLTRRGVLKLTAIGGITALASPAAGASNERVFVHPVGDRRDAIEATRAHGGSVIHTYDTFQFVAARIPTDSRDSLESDSRVARVEDDGTAQAIPHSASGTDDDGPQSCADHPSESPSWGWERLNAGDASTTGKNVDVAILDTGIYSDHCDLTETVAGGVNCIAGTESQWTDRNGHGTHCAGIAGAASNDIGVVGVASEANLWGVKVLTDAGYGRWSDIICGVDWCLTNEREVISMSLGGTYNETMAEVLTTAADAGHLIVGAAGNGGNDGDGHCEEDNVVFPATHSGVIGVAAMDPDDTIASYSSVSSEDVELLAPGTSIRSTWTNNEYDTISGTSMACPHVTGTAALAWEKHQADGPDPEARSDIRSTLRETAVDTLDSCAEGAGLVQADAAVDELD